jgi:hypothetical protein
MATTRSSTLFHFTKSIDAVQSILLNGFVPFYSLEDMSWLGSSRQKFFGFPIVCFCDIPIGRITDHVGFYGSYGLGMSRDWALRNGINPIAYYSQASPICHEFLEALRGAQDMKTKDPNDKTRDCLHTMLAYAKPVSGTIIVQGSHVLKDFYLENEWRYVPMKPKLLYPIHRTDMDDPAQCTALNKKAEKESLKFIPADVRYIFVKQDADIPPLINYINDNLQNYSAVDLKILMSRVTSLEHLEKDI